MELPRLQSFPAPAPGPVTGVPQGWLHLDTAEVLLPHAAGKEDKLAFMNILNSNIT